MSNSVSLCIAFCRCSAVFVNVVYINITKRFDLINNMVICFNIARIISIDVVRSFNILFGVTGPRMSDTVPCITGNYIICWTLRCSFIYNVGCVRMCECECFFLFFFFVCFFFFGGGVVGYMLMYAMCLRYENFPLFLYQSNLFLSIAYNPCHNKTSNNSWSMKLKNNHIPK